MVFMHSSYAMIFQDAIFVRSMLGTKKLPRVRLDGRGEYLSCLKLKVVLNTLIMYLFVS